MKNNNADANADSEMLFDNISSSIFCVAADEAGMRLDVFLSLHCHNLSRSQISKSCKEAKVFVNHRPEKASFKVSQGDHVYFSVPGEKQSKIEADFSIQLDIIYEDQDILIVNKPAGLMVHPGSGRKDEPTLAGALLSHFPGFINIGDEQRPGVVHRLDRDTSGIMITAKNQLSFEFLIKSFSARQVSKLYLAFVAGKLKNASGRIEAPIGRHPVHRHKMAVLKNGGREALSIFKVLRYFPIADVSLLAIRLVTGRTHQARVHMQWIGHPILGDLVYSRGAGGLLKKDPYLMSIKRHMLHARNIGFTHPASKNKMSFRAPWPDDFIMLLKYLLKCERKY